MPYPIYGCCNINLMNDMNKIFDYDIEYKIEEIVKNFKKPKRIKYKDIKNLKKYINNYNINERKQIAEYYDNIREHFIKFYENNNNNPLDKKYINYLHGICNKLIGKLKIKFNMPRPYQVGYYYNECIFPIQLESTHTPTCPSGHTALYYLLYLYFRKIDPLNEKIYRIIYLNGSKSRIIAGVHFEQDNLCSIQAIDLIRNNLNL